MRHSTAQHDDPMDDAESLPAGSLHVNTPAGLIHEQGLVYEQGLAYGQAYEAYLRERLECEAMELHVSMDDYVQWMEDAMAADYDSLNLSTCDRRLPQPLTGRDNNACSVRASQAKRFCDPSLDEPSKRQRNSTPCGATNAAFAFASAAAWRPAAVARAANQGAL